MLRRLVLAAFLAAAPAMAEPLLPVVHVRDGDTIVVGRPDATDTFDVVRVLGLNTPEKRSTCTTLTQRNREQQAALRATNRTRQLVAPGVTLERAGRDRDRYGRLLRRVRLADGRLLADVLIAEGHGLPYDGRGRAAVMFCR